MAQPTYTTRAIVLRKTKLGEADLILTLLAQDGSQLRTVAKGARKPGSPFASRLELYAVADLLCSKGRSLDIVKEARLAEGNERLRRNIEHAAAAAPMAELASRVTQADLENPKLFACTRAAFATLDALDAKAAPGICAAHLLKTFAFSGFRPSLHACAVCGAPIDASSQGDLPFSYGEGGLVCSHCRGHTATVHLPARTVGWMRYLMGATFAEASTCGMDADAAFSVLKVCQQWTREHVGANLKSLEFLFTCGLF